MSTMRVTSAHISVVLAVGAALAVPIVIGGAVGSDVHGVGADADEVDVIRASPFGPGGEGRTSAPASSESSPAFAARPRGEEAARSMPAPERSSRTPVRRTRPAEAGSVPTPQAPVGVGRVSPQPATPAASPAPPPAVSAPTPPPPPRATPPAP